VNRASQPYFARARTTLRSIPRDESANFPDGAGGRCSSIRAPSKKKKHQGHPEKPLFNGSTDIFLNDNIQ
jgi:hypothetical protein